MSRKGWSPLAKALIGACALSALLAGPVGAASDGFWIGGGSGGGDSRDHGDRGRGDRDWGDRRGSHPKEVVVDKLGGPYRTIMEGVRAAGWGGIVRVQPGVYVETLDIHQPVTIVGRVSDSDGDKDHGGADQDKLPIIEPQPDKPCAHIDVDGAGFVSLVQLNLRAGTQNVQRACVELESGFLSIKDSTISAPSYVSTVLARGGHLSIELSNIMGGREGVLITSYDPTGTYYLIHNNIDQNITGVKVDGLAQANIVANNIFKNTGDGIIYFQGRGTVVGNEVHDNARAGIVLQDSPQSPTVKANKIYLNAGPGIEVVPSTTPVTSIAGRPLPISKGEICDNLVADNAGRGIDSKVGDLSFNCKNDFNGNGKDRGRKRDGLWGGGNDRDH